MKTTNLKIRTIEDQARSDRLRKTLEAIPSVRSTTVHDGEPAYVDVQYDEGSTTPELLVSKLRQAGFDAAIGGDSVGGAP